MVNANLLLLITYKVKLSSRFVRNVCYKERKFKPLILFLILHIPSYFIYIKPDSRYAQSLRLQK